MAAATTTYFETGRSWDARVAQRNAELMAAQAMRRRGVRTPRRRKACSAISSALRSATRAFQLRPVSK